MHPGLQAEPFGVMPSAPRRLRARFVVPLVVVGVLGAGVVALKVTVFAAKQVITASLDGRPLPMPDAGPAAPADEARLLLSTSDLGTGWYVEIPPERDSIAARTASAADRPISTVTTALERAHRTGSTWITDGLVMESSESFATERQSSARAASYIDADAATQRTVSGIPVFVRTRPHNFTDVAFSHGDRFYSFIISPSADSTPLPAGEIDAVVASAVKRATQPATSG